MTNFDILQQERKNLQAVEFKLSVLKSYRPRPEIVEMQEELEELRANIKLSIADLEGAIAAGADDESPLAGWCQI